MAEQNAVPVRGFLLHITHYDPKWLKGKDTERPFDLDLGLELIDTMAEVGLNLLVIDCADGVAYASHPELTRDYTVPMSRLEALVRRAAEHDIEVVPKLNFSQSRYHWHNGWFRPHDRPFDTEEYWRLAFEVIDELIEVCQPPRFFHVGMDEDHSRAYSQYIEAIKMLRRGLAERNLRPVIWNDSSLGGDYLVHAEKSLAAEKAIPKDVVQVIWNYQRPQSENILRLVREGFDVWGGPGRTPELVETWRKDIIRLGGKGLLLTNWIHCGPENRAELVGFLRTLGPACSGG